MKKVKRYICEVCGTEYSDKKRCVECEKGHKKPARIVKAITLNALGKPIAIEFVEDNRAGVKDE